MGGEVVGLGEGKGPSGGARGRQGPFGSRYCLRLGDGLRLRPRDFARGGAKPHGREVIPTGGETDPHSPHNVMVGPRVGPKGRPRTGSGRPSTTSLSGTRKYVDGRPEPVPSGGPSGHPWAAMTKQPPGRVALSAGWYNLAPMGRSQDPSGRWRPRICRLPAAQARQAVQILTVAALLHRAGTAAAASH